MVAPVSDVVLLDVDDRVATITLNRPEVRNAINGELGATLARTVGDCEARDDVDVLILTGADPAFCAGADLNEITAGRDPAQVRLPGTLPASHQAPHRGDQRAGDHRRLRARPEL